MEKSTEKTDYSAIKKPISIVQRFLLDHSGYFFSVKMIREKLTEKGIILNHKTVRSSLRELILLKIGMEKKVDRVGERNIYVHFYRHNKNL